MLLPKDCRGIGCDNVIVSHGQNYKVCPDCEGVFCWDCYKKHFITCKTCGVEYCSECSIYCLPCNEDFCIDCNHDCKEDENEDE